MTPSTDLAVGLVRAWVRLYTAGLPLASRDARRGEMDSDLWEHQWYANSSGNTAAETALAVLGRCLRGMPADLSWRLQLKGDEAMLAKALVERGAGLLMMLVVAFLVASLFSAGGTGGGLEYFKDDFPTLAANLDRFATALLLQAIASGVMICAAAALYLTLPSGPTSRPWPPSAPSCCWLRVFSSWSAPAPAGPSTTWPASGGRAGERRATPSGLPLGR